MRNIRHLTRIVIGLSLLAGTAIATSASLSGAALGESDLQQHAEQLASQPSAGELVTGKGGKGGGKGGGGGDGTTSSRIAFAAAVDGHQLFTVNPDGSGSAQLTTSSSGSNMPLSWTADHHILVDNDGWLRLLNVSDSADPTTVAELYRWQTQTPWQGYADISQHANAGNVMALADQLVAVIEGEAEHNLVAYSPDGSGRLPLTSYVSTYVPGGDGIEYEVRDMAWLPDSVDGSRIRLWYTLLEREWLDGAVQSTVITHRVVTLSTAGWPAITTIGSGDKPLSGDLSGVSDVLFFSRDGTKAAYTSPGGYDVVVADVSYDETTDTVTVGAASATTVMDSAVNGVRASSGGMSFSPDNGQLAFQGRAVEGKWTYTSVFAIEVAAGAAPDDIDGQRRKASVGPVWGP